MAGRHLRSEQAGSIIAKHGVKGVVVASVAGTLTGISAPLAFASPVVKQTTPNVTQAVAATVDLGLQPETFAVPEVAVVTDNNAATLGSVWETAAVDIEAEEAVEETPEVAVEALAVPRIAVPTSASASASEIATLAASYVGAPYVYGGTTPAGWDCSGFTAYVFAQFGISLPHNSEAQSVYGTVVSAAEAQPGDLLWWPGHVGIYLGDGMHVAAVNPGYGTAIMPVYGGATYIRIAP